MHTSNRSADIGGAVALGPPPARQAPLAALWLVMFVTRTGDNTRAVGRTAVHAKEAATSAGNIRVFAGDWPELVIRAIIEKS